MTSTANFVRISRAIVAVAAGATITFSAGASSALAPEPAKLVATYALTSTGHIGPARYLSGGSTTIVRWPASGTANADGSPHGGQPCTTTYLAPGGTTAKVIRVSGSSRFCW